MSQIDALRRLLDVSRAASGRVVGVANNGRFRVATAQGILEVTGAGLAVGDAVTVKNGQASKTQRGAGQVFLV